MASEKKKKGGGREVVNLLTTLKLKTPEDGVSHRRGFTLKLNAATRSLLCLAAFGLPLCLSSVVSSDSFWLCKNSHKMIAGKSEGNHHGYWAGKQYW